MVAINKEEGACRTTLIKKRGGGRTQVFSALIMADANCYVQF